MRFYGEAFGWLPAPAEIHDYVVLAVPDDCPFGIGIVPSPAAGGVGPILYYACDDPAGMAQKVVAAGGLMRFGPTKLFGYGEIYQLEDPSGVRWGLYKKTTLPKRD